MAKRLNFSIGQKFGKWTIEEKLEEKQQNCFLWLCKCECGKQSKVTGSALMRGKSNGCPSCVQKNNGVCENGHDLTKWGLTKDFRCKGCIKNRNLLREYGITLEEYTQLWELQDGKCAICKKEINLYPKGVPGWQECLRTEVDHKHVLKDKKFLGEHRRYRIRGLLCGGRWSGCNRKLGRIDDEAWLKAAMEYTSNPPASKVLVRKNENKQETNSESKSI